MRYNEKYVIKKTLLGRLYLANQETGDVVDVNPITVDILETIFCPVQCGQQAVQYGLFVVNQQNVFHSQVPFCL